MTPQKLQEGRDKESTLCISVVRSVEHPKRPKIETNQDLPEAPGLKFSSEIENVKRATHQTPYFLGNSEGFPVSPYL